MLNSSFLFCFSEGSNVSTHAAVAPFFIFFYMLSSNSCIFLFTFLFLFEIKSTVDLCILSVLFSYISWRVVYDIL